MVNMVRHPYIASAGEEWNYAVGSGPTERTLVVNVAVTLTNEVADEVLQHVHEQMNSDGFPEFDNVRLVAP